MYFKRFDSPVWPGFCFVLFVCLFVCPWVTFQFRLFYGVHMVPVSVELHAPMSVRTLKSTPGIGSHVTVRTHDSTTHTERPQNTECGCPNGKGN